MIFKSLFSIDGIMNTALVGIGMIAEPISWLTHPVWAKFVIILTITWRWTGYNTVFYLAGLQNINRSVYEAARIDGASASRQFFFHNHSPPAQTGYSFDYHHVHQWDITALR